ncbi:6176_t:CDS:1 [Diversispora eburnea]|uniref:6176_t:CDS:1 n=1 Tax=Diversispora eburnea TaxID=1213867 RepID=A0A9N9C1A6_9GLOM|nr:6176_t:CDS:1 [Diversispora eburnea]
MKSYIFNLIVLVALFSLDFIEAKREPPNKYITPIQAGICKTALVKSNGTQNPNGECSSQILGDLPSSSKMVSTLIVSPENGAEITANKRFKIRVEISNLQTGFFADPATDYYDVPQTLTEDGIIRGHVHISVQKLIGNGIPNPNLVEFFEGLSDVVDNKGGLETEVPGLFPGFYRLCTMTASESHQPVVMPVARRGSQDDCIRFSVT